MVFKEKFVLLFIVNYLIVLLKSNALILEPHM